MSTVATGLRRETYGDPFLDLDSDAYELSEDQAGGAVVMTSPVCRETGVRIERTVTLGLEPGTWAVAMMLRPATVFMPTARSSTFPDGVRTFDNAGASASARDTVMRFVGDIAIVSCHEPIKFKYGVDADVCRILAVLETDGDAVIGYRKLAPVFHPLPFGHGCVVRRGLGMP